MIYETYDAKQRFATRFHKGNEFAPDGWPSEANPLAAGEDAPNGYFVRTGEELNKLRAKLYPEFAAICQKHEASGKQRAAIRDADATTSANIGGGFEWPDGSGQRFSLSLAAQMNNMHDTAGPFPVTRSTLDGQVVELDAKQFATFCAAARDEIRLYRAEGNAAKAVLAKDQ